MTNSNKIKIHVKNNHWAPGSFPTDAEGEKNFTITKEHLDEALKDFPEIKKKVEIFFDWDEDNFKTSMSNSDILLASGTSLETIHYYLMIAITKQGTLNGKLEIQNFFG